MMRKLARAVAAAIATTSARAMPDTRAAGWARRAGPAMALAIAAAVAAPAQAGLTVDGTELVLTTPDGRTLRSADLVGATLTMVVAGAQVAVTISGVEEDRDAVGGRVLLHHLVVKGAAGKAVELCSPDASGRSLGFPIPDGRGGIELTCTSGAVGKCIRWGYRPWEQRPGGPPLAALHAACVRMARADYGGDGHATTRAGTLIYWCDRFGVHPCLDGAVPVPFEAAWGPDGATCVAHPRIAGSVTLGELALRYPRLRPRLGPTCTLASAMRDPAALLFNGSGQ